MQYRTIVADPPWPVKRLASPGAKGFGTHTGYLDTVPLPYPCMAVEKIAALNPPAERAAHLYLWTINAHIESAYAVARAWGFRPLTLLTWVKTPMGLGLGSAFSQTTEFVLFARRGSLRPLCRMDTSWWHWRRGEHSQKPEAFLDLVEQVSPPPYLELFARRQRLGWDTWGDECFKHVALEAGA